MSGKAKFVDAINDPNGLFKRCDADYMVRRVGEEEIPK